MARRRGPAEITVKPRRATVLDPARMRLDHAAWRALKRKFKAHNKAHHVTTCWLEEHDMCLLPGVPIDYQSSGIPDSFETDHKTPRSVDPSLWLVWANLRPSHLRCNRSRQAKPVDPQPQWVRPRF
jgi:5-methylcytosine-specific restriction endonuclease McrA